MVILQSDRKKISESTEQAGFCFHFGFFPISRYSLNSHWKGATDAVKFTFPFTDELLLWFLPKNW